MDPVTAFSIACGVIQVVDFSLQVLSNFRDFYKEGEIAANAGVADQAADLVALESSLGELVAGGASAPFAQLSREDLELRELARKCVGTAKELTRQIAALKPATGRKRDAFKSSIKSMWKRNEMQDIQEKLDEYRKALDTRVLVNLSKRSDLQSLANSKAFDSLHLNVQKLITALQQGHVTTEKLVRNEGILIRSHITQELNRLQPSKDAELTEQLRRSLYFHDVFVRREEVATAHRNTFKWIFDESVTAMRPWDNYAQWLRNGHGMYWISGKAGSGKSTLMNFILEDERTKRALLEWSGSNQLITPSFFFSSLGSKLQKSTSGLLRALVYQIIGASTMLAGILLDENPNIWPFGAGNRSELDITWTDQKLRTALRFLVNQSTFPLHQCFFIDGFDELEDGHSQMLELFAELEQNPRVKLCVASRPWAIFETAFKSTPRLRLQDLTRSDIELYVEDKLNPSWLSFSGTSDPGWISTISRTIVNKADGCFLWCYLVVLTVLDGLACGDGLVELKQRLDILPTEIEGLYKHLVNSIHPVHKHQIARLLMIQMEVSRKEGYHESNRSLLFVFALTTYLSYKNDLTWPMQLTDGKILEECERIKSAVSTKTKGLLEIYDADSTRKLSTADRAQTLELWKRYASTSQAHSTPVVYEDSKRELREHFCNIEYHYVKFFHKSALDFLRDNSEILESFSPVRLSQLDQAHFLRASLQAHMLHLHAFKGATYASCRAYFPVFQRAGKLIALSRDPEEALMDELCSVMHKWRSSNTYMTAEEPWAIFPVPQRGNYPWGGLEICVDDFLHHAATHRMTPFVLHKIKQVSQDRKDEVKASLPLYALLPVDRKYMYCDATNIHSTAVEILKSGAQPNLVQNIRYAHRPTTSRYQPYPRKRSTLQQFEEEITPWKQCLTSMLIDLTDICRKKPDVSTGSFTESRNQSVQGWMNLVALFLDAGANINETITISFPAPLTTRQLFESHKGNPTPGRGVRDYDECALFWNISAVRVIETCFEEQACHGDIYNKFWLHGAKVFRSSPLLLVYRIDRKEFEHTMAVDLLNEEELVLLEHDLKKHEDGLLDFHDRKDLFPSFRPAFLPSKDGLFLGLLEEDRPDSDRRESSYSWTGGPLDEKKFNDTDCENGGSERHLFKFQFKQNNDTTPGITALVRRWEKNNQSRTLRFGSFWR